jgi:hypothetical protein
MKIIVTTSDNYFHLLPIFFHLFKKNWGGEIELVGYKTPPDLPQWVTFVSLGEQRGPKYFCDDLAPYFAKQEQHFIWLMEDYFIHSVDKEWLAELKALIRSNQNIGRIGLTKDVSRRAYEPFTDRLVLACKGTMYRQSTQPSIWRREFLLLYMKPGMTPWQFELQATDKDDYLVIGTIGNCVRNNEGTNIRDIHHLNLEGFDKETINELKPWLSNLTY